MTDAMQWEKLLAKERFSRNVHGTPPIDHMPSNTSVFEDDIERIRYASAFRRLQGKTQVHPFPEFDYLRTRLTHTNEVAHVGRCIARRIAEEIASELPSGRAQDLSDIVEAACLAHDMGNPPFGHIGEYAIQTWFERNKETPVVKELFDADHGGLDFLYFDGNAQGFRILIKLAGWRERDGGLQLSYATLGAFSKYPYSSTKADPKKKKFGYMNDDELDAEKVFSELGMKASDGTFMRHPLAYVMEAADDICYIATDIEDAFRMDLLEFHEAEQLLKNIGEMGGRIPRYASLQTASKLDRIAYLRAGAVSALRDGVVECFCQDRTNIMRGNYIKSLVESSKYIKYVNNIKKSCEETIYVNRKKMLTEAAGYNIIMTIMDVYGGMISQYIEKKELIKLDARNYGIYQLLPVEFKERLTRTQGVYEAFLVLVDYVSGMTDRYILELYQTITGTSLSLGRMN